MTVREKRLDLICESLYVIFMKDYPTLQEWSEKFMLKVPQEKYGRSPMIDLINEMQKTEYYILRGKKAFPCNDVIKWAEWFEKNQDKKIVAKTSVDNSSISTVFLGLNHRFGVGRPLIFETMVFGGPLDGEMARYSTWKEAEAGHEAMIVKVSEYRDDA